MEAKTTAPAAEESEVKTEEEAAPTEEALATDDEAAPDETEVSLPICDEDGNPPKAEETEDEAGESGTKEEPAKTE